MERLENLVLKGVCVIIISGVIMAFGSSLRADNSFREKSEEEPVDMVFPLLDAAHSRWFFFNSASRPFGMVNLSPDMVVKGSWNSGYRYHEDSIKVFSHIHGWQLSGIPVFPFTGKCRGYLGPDVYGSSYSHHNERVKVGYHQVFLSDYHIDVELTSTVRVGFHRYTYPSSVEGGILFDFSTFLGPADTDSAYIRKVSEREIEGYVVMAPTLRRPKEVRVHFVAMLDRPADQVMAWKNGALIGTLEHLQGERIGCYFSFSTVKDEVRLMKVGISYVSVAQARLNLETELPHWDFDRIVGESRQEWNELLSRIEISGGTTMDRRRFYTDLWHALLGRQIVSDVDGQYCDMTGDKKRTGQIPLGKAGFPLFHHYNSDSFWGTHWNLCTLWHLVYPEISEALINAMLLMYDDGGLVPRGPSGGNYTYVMTGAPFTPFVVSAFMKGIRGFDVEKAYEGLKKNHLPGGMMSHAGYEHYSAKGGGLEDYMERGYVPWPLTDTVFGYHQDGSSQTLEYAYQDWALAQLAGQLGYEADREHFLERSGNYRNIWHADSGWMWVRHRNGEWKKPFRILEYGNGWIEGNAAQYTWYVPHDIRGLATLMGGEQALSDRLNRSFEAASLHDFTSGKSHSVETELENREVYINYGNQPSLHTAYIFNQTGQPWRSQYWSRQVVEKVYSGLSPDFGYSGDEDQGQMGAQAVLMKMGIYSIDGGVSPQPFYEIGSPIFDTITIHLNPNYYQGEKFTIRTTGNGPGNYYIRSAKLNGRPYSEARIRHADMTAGGELMLEMGNIPNTAWGIDTRHDTMR